MGFDNLHLLAVLVSRVRKLNVNDLGIKRKISLLDQIINVTDWSLTDIEDSEIQSAVVVSAFS